MFGEQVNFLRFFSINILEYGVTGLFTCSLTINICFISGHGLAAVVDIIKAEYNRRSLLKPLLWENTIQLPIEEVYTRLKIVSRRKRDFKLVNNEVNMYNIFKNKDVIALVEGSPGIGKTTFCLKIAYDWANEKIPKEYSFPEFEIVLLLKCRDIDGDIMEAIDEQLLPEDMFEYFKKELMGYLKDFQYQENVLIILDGLDELPKKAESHVDRLLHRKILPYCYVLVTSRQEIGIVVRQKVDFDILLQIEGFTIENAFEYIRKHFKNAGPEQLPTGEKLIKEIQENAFLHALLNNPLNLLLLCVVFEDYQGELPSVRTELYQIIVRCLLRRYCAKHNLEAPDDDEALEKQFEDSLLALGELAWRCLREKRHSFREEELVRFESSNKTLAARNLGLVFKEASVKRIKPQHEYHFFHKTFQEYLAASYLAHKLLKEQVNVFRDLKLTFDKHIIEEYRQVFLFVSGILGEDASVLFGQIGEMLKSEDWDWHECSEEEASFFIESFNESRNAEQVAMALCSFIPFPLTLNIGEIYTADILRVVNACKNFSRLQQPLLLIVKVEELQGSDINSVVDFIASCSELTTFSLSVGLLSVGHVEDSLCTALSGNFTLSSCTDELLQSIRGKDLIRGITLVASKISDTVTFKLDHEDDDAWAITLATGLSPTTPLTSVDLKIYGSVGNTAIKALKGILSNRSLTSLDLIIYGDMTDSQAAAVGEGLAAESILRSFSLIVYGKLSYAGAVSLKKGFKESTSLNSLKAKVFGELPGHCVTITENVIKSKQSIMSLTVHPNIAGKITAQVVPLYPGFELQSLTLNLWGKLRCNEAETLCELLIKTPTSFVTLNMHGRVTDDVADCFLRYLKQCKTPSSFRINIWGELTSDGNSALQELCNQRDLFSFSVCGVTSDDWIFRDLDSINNFPYSLMPTSTNVEDTLASTLSVNITNYRDMNRDWGHGLPKSTSSTTHILTFNGCVDVSGDWVLSLRDGLAKNTSFTTLSLAFNDFSGTGGGWGRVLGDSLAKNSSLTTLSLTFCRFSVMTGDWARGLCDGLAKNTSLTTLSLTFNGHNDMSEDCARGLGDGLAKNTSLTTLSLTFCRFSVMTGDWARGLGGGLAKNTSLTTLSLTFNDCSDMGEDWARGLCDGLAKNTSLTTLSLTFNGHNDMSEDCARGLGGGLAKNTSLTTLSLTFNDCSDMGEDWARGLGDGLAENTSLTTLSLTFNECSTKSELLARDLGDGLAKNTSLTTLSLTFYRFSVMCGDWARGLGDGLAKNRSLTTLRLKFNDCSAKSELLARDLGDGLAKNTSLTTLSLTFNSFIGRSGDLARGLGDGLAKNRSLTTLSLTFNGFSGMREDQARGVGDGLAKNTSLTTLSLKFNSYSVVSEDWGRGLGDGLAKNTSLTTLSLTFDSCCTVSGDWAHGLGDGLAKSTSLTTLSLTFNGYCTVYGDWGRGLGDGLAKNTSLTTLSLTFDSYSVMSGDWARGLSDGLAKNTSLTTLSLTFNNYSDINGEWARSLGDGLEKNTSLTTLSLVFDNYIGTSGDCLNYLCDSLAKSDSIATLSLTINDYSDTSNLGCDLGNRLAKCKSLTSVNLTVGLYGEAIVC